MRESIGVHHGALLRIPGDVPAYREDRPNGIGSSSNRIQTAHQKCRVLTEPTHSRMVAYSEVTVELENFLHHSRVGFWETPAFAHGAMNDNVLYHSLSGLASGQQIRVVCPRQRLSPHLFAPAKCAQWHF